MRTVSVPVPAQAEIDDTTDDGQVRNSVRAEHGRAAALVGCIDWEDPETSAADAIANILHYLDVEAAGSIDPADVLQRALAYYEAES